MQSTPKDNFKQELIQLKEEFFACARSHPRRAVPLKQLVVMLHKYLHIRPVELYSLLSRSLDSGLVTWDKLLSFLYQDIALRDQVNKLSYSRPSTIEIIYQRNPDRQLDQQISAVTAQVKKKETNLIKWMATNEFLGFKMVTVILEKELIFYDAYEGKIIRKLEFTYHNVRSKTLLNQKANNSSHINTSNREYFDRVDPMSRRTDDFIFTEKLRKNTNNSEDLKNAIMNRSIKKSKMESSVCSESVRRSVTDVGNISRSITRLGYNKLSSLGKVPQKKPMAKIRSSDNQAIFKIMTEAPIENSLQFIGAVRNSRETFQKYIVIDKEKIEPQKTYIEKVPDSMPFRRNFQTEIINMRETTKELSLKKNVPRPETKRFLSSYSVRKGRKQERDISHMLSAGDAYSVLQKKVLGIQSVSLVQNYLLISLMNREVRLYRFKKTISGFEDELVLERQYDHIISYVVMYRSQVRGLYNFVAAKYVSEEQTKLYVYELTADLQKCQQTFSTSVAYAPSFQPMLPLGIAGFSEKGYFFLLELNSPGQLHSQNKSIDTHLVDTDSGARVSISCLALHNDQISLYIGSKDGFIYVYDRYSLGIRMKSQVGKHGIRYLHFLDSCSQILFWEQPDRIGIAHANTLHLSSSTVIEPKYEAILPFFSENNYLIYGSRIIGCLSLKESQQKKFQIQKPIKMLKRREKIGKKTHKQLQNTQEEEEPSAHKSSQTRKILRYFLEDHNSLVMICSDGQIMVYDTELSYTGSFFTLNFETVNHCGVCYNLKYLSLLYENNQIEVVNIYTQDIVLNPPHGHEEIYEVFFCHSAVYLCGYLTALTCKLMLFGFDGQVLAKASMEGLARHQIKEKSCVVKFYKGALIMVKINNGEIIFFMKKTCERKHTLNCWRPNSDIQIVDLCMGKQSGLLTIVRSDSVIQLINLDTKEVSAQWHFPKQTKLNRKILQHRYEAHKESLSVLWALPSSFFFSKYKVISETRSIQFENEEEFGKKDSSLLLEDLVLQDVCILRQGRMELVGENLLKEDRKQEHFKVVAGPLKSTLIPISNF